jgi:hypothetical protein
MRRPLAILLALFFALGPLQGLLEASDDMRLPACCRRNGAHHCAMSADMMAALTRAMDSTPGFTAPSTCPSFPGWTLGCSTPAHAIAPSQLRLPVLFEQAFTPITVHAVVRTIPDRMHAGRAPPVCS